MEAPPGRSRGGKRPAEGPLSLTSIRSPLTPVNPLESVKRHHHDSLKRKNNSLGEKDHGNAREDPAVSGPQSNIFKNSESARGVTQMQNKSSALALTPRNVCPPSSNCKPAVELAPAKKPAVESTSVPKAGDKKHVVSEELTLGAFLENLGLSKYQITFQVEEVDMASLKLLNDNDLKSLGLPMGPRKKILLALAPPKFQR
ncbi:hypothetical protein J5N97_027829 [Dioscorea zingiberensis]|uniref:SAM domain-containing protein n=1 Tax=Dioscorea zingiberensis TaxID=325984 RepID=A0A9D5BXE4_9LILI|nr:hypothetical protein J5N97_027829 [Dioscorea zingiberensis]